MHVMQGSGIPLQFAFSTLPICTQYMYTLINLTGVDSPQLRIHC